MTTTPATFLKLFSWDEQSVELIVLVRVTPFKITLAHLLNHLMIQFSFSTSCSDGNALTSGTPVLCFANYIFSVRGRFSTYDIFLPQGHLRSKRLASLVSSLSEVNCNTFIDTANIEVL